MALPLGAQVSLRMISDLSWCWFGLFLLALVGFGCLEFWGVLCLESEESMHWLVMVRGEVSVPL